MVWLIIGMGLYRDRPITDVVTKLDLVLGDTLAASSIAQARERLSDKPLEALFHLTAQHWTRQEDKDDLWCGLRLFAVDGTLFRTPDTPELAEHFEYIKHRPDRHTEYPDKAGNEPDSERSQSVAAAHKLRDGNEADKR